MFTTINTSCVWLVPSPRTQYSSSSLNMIPLGAFFTTSPRVASPTFKASFVLQNIGISSILGPALHVTPKTFTLPEEEEEKEGGREKTAVGAFCVWPGCALLPRGLPSFVNHVHARGHRHIVNSWLVDWVPHLQLIGAIIHCACFQVNKQNKQNTQGWMISHANIGVQSIILLILWSSQVSIVLY